VSGNRPGSGPGGCLVLFALLAVGFVLGAVFGAAAAAGRC
jgi:hypothetical protein